MSDIVCDCGHYLLEHTDRGENADAGLCLVIGCTCDEFIESEGPDAAAEGERP